MLGFRLLRSAGSREAAVEVTSQLIAALDVNGPAYAFVDASLPAPGAYRYWLVEVDAMGTETEYGPVDVVVRSRMWGRSNVETLKRKCARGLTVTLQ